MANQQLLDYVKQQMQLGVPKEAIKSALLASGWPAAEVDDALGVTGGPASPATASVAASASPVSASASAASAAAKPASGGISFGSMSAGLGKESVFKPMSPTSNAKTFDDIGHPAHPHHWLLPAILGVVVVALLAGLWYLYSQNSVLSGQIQSSSDSTGSLGQQLNAANMEKVNLTSQINDLNASKKNLETLLSLYSATLSSSELPITLSGTIGGNDKTGYTLTTPEQILVNIKNSKDVKLSAALKPLAGTAAALEGTYQPGSKAITVLKVNGTDLAALAPAATSTATSTP